MNMCKYSILHSSFFYRVPQDMLASIQHLHDSCNLKISKFRIENKIYNVVTYLTRSHRMEKKKRMREKSTRTKFSFKFHKIIS